MINKVVSTDISIDDINGVIDTLKLEDNGVRGLSFNEININKRVCYINIKNPIILINPTIIERSDDVVIYYESCRTVPKSHKKLIKTVRNTKIKVQTDNLGEIEFGPDYVEGRKWKTNEEFFSDIGLQESVYVQKHIDLLDGIQITNRVYTTTVVNTKKYGRNDRVLVKLQDGTMEYMKYKKATELNNIEIM